MKTTSLILASLMFGGMAGAQSLEGVVDLHVHFAPDVVARSVDAVELARIAHARGMRAIVLKNHYEATVTPAYLARKQNPGIEVFGSITLNRSVGGVNPAAVERMIQVEGNLGKVVWMPTNDAENQVRHGKADRPFVPISRNGQLLPEVKQVLDLIAKNSLVLGTGHSSAEEDLLLIREAKSRGVRWIMATHPMTAPVGMSLEQMKEAALLGAFIEFPANTVIGNGATLSAQKVVEAIRAIGPEHCILSSDLGQAGNPLPPDGLAQFFEVLQKSGLSVSDIDKMAKENPARILGFRDFRQ